MPSYAVIKLKLRAEVGDHEFLDVVQYTSAFAMNAIPVASLLVAVGRNVDTDEPATIHEAYKDLKVQQIAKVYLTATIEDGGIEDALPGLPNGEELLIFEGKAVGTGWRRTENGAHFTLHILHWIGDINYASAISASSHPGNPADLTYPAIYKAIGPPPAAGGEAGVGTSGDPSWVPMLNKSLVNQGKLTDLWGESLHQWMTAISNDDPFEVNLAGGQPGGGDENTLAALARMGANPDGVPLNVDLGGANAEVLSEGLRQALINETGGNWVNTTLWGKLIGEWAPAYWFSVVPRVEDALIVPFTGGLQGEPWAVIGTEDYVQSDLNSQMSQVLRAVGIMHPVMFFSGIDMNMGAIPVDRGGTAGWYQPPGVEKGMVLFKKAPKWIMDPVLPYEFSFDAEGIGGKPINNVLDEEDTGDDRKPARDIEGNQKSHKGFMTKFAKQWYVIEALKGRVGELSGKLRFDIAPGSNIKVIAGGARNLEQDALKEDVFATVVQVSYLINAESQKAGTTFTLAHIRSEKENQEEGTSIAGPPLYQEPWPGAKLVKDAPGPEN